MGSIPPGELSRVKELRDRIEQCAPQLQGAAHGVALRFGLPWELSRLRKTGEQGVVEALRHRKDQALGLPFPQAADGEIQKAMQGLAQRLHKQKKGGFSAPPPPSEECVKEALETFSADEWKRLIAAFGEEDLRPLRCYLDENRRQLVGTLGRAKYWRILEATVTRGMIMHLSWAAKKRRKFIRYLDAFYAVYWRESRRRENRQGVPRSPGTRLMETVSLTKIARALSGGGHKVTPKKVAGMFKRWKETPFESFTGDPSDYWLIITDAHAYNRYKRRLSRDRE